MRLPGGPPAESGGDDPGGAPVAVLRGRGSVSEAALDCPAQVFRLPLLHPVDAPARGDQLPQSLAARDMLGHSPAAAGLGTSQYALHGGGHRLLPT